MNVNEKKTALKILKLVYAIKVANNSDFALMEILLILIAKVRIEQNKTLSNKDYDLLYESITSNKDLMAIINK